MDFDAVEHRSAVLGCRRPSRSAPAGNPPRFLVPPAALIGTHCGSIALPRFRGRAPATRLGFDSANNLDLLNPSGCLLISNCMAPLPAVRGNTVTCQPFKPSSYVAALRLIGKSRWRDHTATSGRTLGAEFAEYPNRVCTAQKTDTVVRHSFLTS